MTDARDELRRRVYLAMDKAYRLANPFFLAEDHEVALEAAFDALHGIVRVVPPTATTEMIGRGQSLEDEGATTSRIFAAMAAAGDLTDGKR